MRGWAEVAGEGGTGDWVRGVLSLEVVLAALLSSPAARPWSRMRRACEVEMAFRWGGPFNGGESIRAGERGGGLVALGVSSSLSATG